MEGANKHDCNTHIVNRSSGRTFKATIASHLLNGFAKYTENLRNVLDSSPAHGKPPLLPLRLTRGCRIGYTKHMSSSCTVAEECFGGCFATRSSARSAESAAGGSALCEEACLPQTSIMF